MRSETLSERRGPGSLRAGTSGTPRNIRNVFIKLNHPKSISFVRLNGKILTENTNVSILSFVVLYLFLFIIGTIIVVLTGVDTVTASSSVASCMAAIGPGLGTVGPSGNFAQLA